MPTAPELTRLLFKADFYKARHHLNALAALNSETKAEDFRTTLNLISQNCFLDSVDYPEACKNIQIISGMGARALYFYTQMKSVPNNKFDERLLLLSEQIEATYMPREDRETAVTTADVKEMLCALNERLPLFSLLEQKKVSMRLTLLPTTAMSIHNSSKLIVTLPLKDSPQTNYTMFVPSMVFGQSKKRTLEMISTVLTACLCDMVVENFQEPCMPFFMEIRKAWEDTDDNRLIPSIDIYYPKSLHRQKELQIRPRIVSSIYKPVSAHLTVNKKNAVDVAVDALIKYYTERVKPQLPSDKIGVAAL